MYTFPAPGAPLLIPEECSAENNSVTVAWQPPPGHGIIGCAGQRGPAIEGYLLELDDGCGGEFRVSKHPPIYPEEIVLPLPPGETLGSDLEAFSRSPANSSTLHSSDSPSFFCWRPVPVFLYRALLRPSRDDGDTTLPNNGTLRRSHDVFRGIVLRSGADEMTPRKRRVLALNNIWRLLFLPRKSWKATRQFSHATVNIFSKCLVTSLSHAIPSRSRETENRFVII